jgi:parallel beta-helix repeat protein
MDAEMISPGRGGFQSTGRGRRARLDPFVWIAIALTLLAILAFAFTGLLAPSKAKAKAQGGLYCGAYVTQNVTLQHDLYGCVEGGIIIGKSGVTVDLNGHTITGLGEGDGIAAAGVTGVTVKNGSVVNFEAGLRLAGVSGSLVHDVRFSLNSDASAWIEASTGNKFLRLTMTENGDGGFRLIGSSKNRIAGSTVSGASDFGVGLEGLSSYNRMVRNKVTLAGEGVKIDDGTGNRVFRNTLSHNGGAGVEVASDAHQTRINENQTNFNGGDGIFVEAFGAQINRNRSGCNGGLGINATQLAVGKDNVAGANGDNVGCAGVVCRINLSCGAE